MDRQEELVQLLFARMCDILKTTGLTLKTMERQGSKDNKRYIAGYINLRTGIIVLDIYTPKTMKYKSINGLIRVIAHEIAHVQKPPYKQYHRGRWIVRQHFPLFYKQVERNIEKIKKDPILGNHFKS
jgi:hypothetical protein